MKKGRAVYGMSEKKAERGFLLFLKDNVWFIISCFIYLCFIWAYVELDGFERDKNYFFLLSVFFFAVVFLLRYERTKRIYIALNKNEEKPDVFAFIEEKAPIEKAYKEKIKQYVQLYHQLQSQFEQDRTNYKVMINQWVHQMKTPISVIRLISESRTDEKAFRDILNEVERLNEKLTQVINMTKLEEAKHDIKIERVSLYQAGRQVINEMKNLFIQKEIYPTLDIDKKLYVYSDYKWIQFILMQFLSNGIKYSEKGTRIEVKAYWEEQNIVLSVIDNGCGINKGDMPYVFDLFYTGKHTKSRGESTGLGLYMVKQITEYLGHDVEAISEEGQGTEMRILFHSKQINK